MGFTFRTTRYSVVDYLLEKQGFPENVLTECIESNQTYTIVFESDTCIRELYQWAAAAFACGLIESPRIERM